MVTAVTVVVGECIQGQDRSPGSRPACRTNRCTTASTSLTSTAHRRHRRADEPNPSASPPAASGQTERWRCALRVFKPGALKLTWGGVENGQGKTPSLRDPVQTYETLQSTQTNMFTLLPSTDVVSRSSPLWDLASS